MPPKFIPLTVSWNLTRRCNLACAHCYIEASAQAKDPRELSAEQASGVLRQLARVNPQAVLILTGGEPLLRPDLYALLAEASRLGFWTVLGSHGGLIDEHAAARLAAAGLRGVGVSLDSLDAAAHDRFRGVGKAWENTVKALDALRSTGLPFLIEMTVTRANRSELSAMARFAVDKGAAALNAFFLVPTGRGARLNDLTAAQCEETLRELAAVQKRHAGRLLIHAKCAPHYHRVLWEADRDSPYLRSFSGGGCPAGSYYCRIDPSGEVTPCPYMPLSVGNVLETPFEAIWRDSPVLRRLREAPRGGRCGSCEFSALCGGCRCRAFAATGDYLAEDPGCSYAPGRYAGGAIALPAERTYGAPSGEGLPWTAQAQARLDAIPFFARGMVQRAVETAARRRGATVVTEELLGEIRRAMAGRFPPRPT